MVMDYGNKIMISVIIPVYNTERYLEQCIKSVIVQSYKMFEILLVDDGSTDQCGKICDEFNALDNRIIVIHQNNAGQSAARNAAIDYASGKYIFFLDSDDYLQEEALKQLLLTAEINDADFVYYNAQSFLEDESDGNLKIINARANYLKKFQYRKANGCRQLVELMNHGEYCVCVWLHFFKREYLNQNVIRFMEGIIHEDNLFTAKAYLCDGITAYCYCNQYMRRFRSGSLMTSLDKDSLVKKFRSNLIIFHEMDKMIKELKPESNAGKYIISQQVNCVSFAYSVLPRDEKRKQMFLYLKWQSHVLIHYGVKLLCLKFLS